MSRTLILADQKLAVHSAKTACALLRHDPGCVVAVLDRQHAGQTVQDVLGFGGAIPIVGSVKAGAEYQPDRFLLGIANPGGVLPDAWRGDILQAIDAGMDVVNGLHFFLRDDDQISAAAAAKRVALIDLRAVPDDLTTPDGSRERLQIPVVLAVGSDCSVGKMTAMMQVWDVAKERGASWGFVATGQTGILLTGEGIAIDRVISDFVAGAAERYTVQGAQGKELVLVEGQGSLTHPFFSGVTLGLLHGTQPDAMILCHDTARRAIRHSHVERPIPPLTELIRIYEEVARWVRPGRVIGIALATHLTSEDDARRAIEAAREETGLPAEDAVRFPTGVLYDACEAFRREFEQV